MTKIIIGILYLVFFISSCSAFNYFQGFFKLAEPCFDVHKNKECNCPIEDVFTPNSAAPASNEPATKLYLFTESSKNTAEQLHLCGGRLPKDSTFDPGCPTEIFVHGLTDGLCRSAWMREMKEQLFQKSGCYNVILVDWTWGNPPQSNISFQNGRAVGQQIAYVIKQISKQKNYDCKNFHVLGNSIGVAPASYAGKYLQDPSCRLGRITGMDPALAPLRLAPESERLNPNDALFVDVIHTNGGTCAPIHIGDSRPMGHVDMYVNDGKNQPSCHPYAVESLLKLDIYWALITLASSNLCSHVQSIQYYKASIRAEEDNSYMIGVLCNNYEDFKSGKCPRNCEKPGTCVPLGIDLPRYLNTSDTERKTFYVPSSLECPYADHEGFTGLSFQRT